MQTAAEVLTLEAYLENMHEWIKRILTKFGRKNSVMFDWEELVQEAQIPLIEVYTKYADTKSPTDLGRLGSQAMYNHVSQLLAKMNARGRGTAVVLSLDDDRRQSETPNGRHVSDPEEWYEPTSLTQQLTPLDSALVRESVESVLAASDDAREVVSIELGRSRDRAAKLRATSLFARSRDAIYSAL